MSSNELPTIRMTFGADPTTMSPSGAGLHRRRYVIVSALLATPAIWIPGIWLAVALAVYFLVRVVRFTAKAAKGGAWGPATLLELPVRATLGVIMALLPTIFVALGEILAVALGIVIVGVLAAGIGVLAALAFHHDTGWLLWADAQSSIARWAPRYGTFIGAWLLAHQALKPPVTAGLAATLPQAPTKIRSFVDNIGEGGLVALTATVVILALVFSIPQFAPWAPASGWRGAAGTAHLTNPINRDISSWLRHDTRVALAKCPAFDSYSSTVTTEGTIRLNVTVTPSAAVAQGDALALAATLVANRVVPLADRITITSTSNGRTVTATLDSNARRFAIVRNPANTVRYLTPEPQVSPTLRKMGPLLKDCSSNPIPAPRSPATPLPSVATTTVPTTPATTAAAPSPTTAAP